jgi:hypothetical protein
MKRRVGLLRESASPTRIVGTHDVVCTIGGCTLANRKKRRQSNQARWIAKKLNPVWHAKIQAATPLHPHRLHAQKSKGERFFELFSQQQCFQKHVLRKFFALQMYVFHHFSRCEK